MSAHLYIEGSKTGRDSKEEQIRCREGFRKLIGKAGFADEKRMPRLSACGGRDSVFDDFKIAHAKSRAGDFIAMLVDSEEPVPDAEKTWEHLRHRDKWAKPNGALDEQVFFMTTCMETWIAADRSALRRHYGHKLQEGALPPLANMEGRDRHDVYDRLAHATRNCANAYVKGKRSFEVLGLLDSSALNLLPSFARMVRILNERL